MPPRSRRRSSFQVRIIVPKQNKAVENPRKSQKMHRCKLKKRLDIIKVGNDGDDDITP